MLEEAEERLRSLGEEDWPHGVEAPRVARVLAGPRPRAHTAVQAGEETRDAAVQVAPRGVDVAE